jgi:hypothetical protein
MLEVLRNVKREKQFLYFGPWEGEILYEQWQSVGHSLEVEMGHLLA